MLDREATIAGKTVQGISYPDPCGEGITILFTDGSKLNVYEGMQAGRIMVKYNGQEVMYEGEDE
jgi:hypothetical protein